MNLEQHYNIKVRQSKSGKWLSRCPACKLRIVAHTEIGTVEKVCEHLNEAHPRNGVRRDS